MREKNISEDRKKYLRKIKRGKIAVIVTQILILLIFIIAWELLAKFGVIDSFITSQPSRVLSTFLNLSSNGLLEHLGVTLVETLVGFVSGVVLGVVIAICLWWSSFLSKVSEPYLVVLNSLPKVALRANHYYLGGSRYFGNYNNGAGNFINSNYHGNFKWFYKYRQRIDENGTKFWSKQTSNFN